MDLLSLYSTLQHLRFGFRDVPPFWDRDLRELYEARLQQNQQKELPRPRLRRTR
jgi:hypothetical protein